MTRSQDIEAKAAEWLMRREQPLWSQADQAALDRWLDESMSHKAAFWRLEHAWQIADRMGALSARDIAPRPRRVGRHLKWWHAGALAASLLLAIAFIGPSSRLTLSPQPSVDIFDTGEGSAFVVHAGPRLITVVGTQFSVRRDADKVTVAVVQGRVRVEDTTPGVSSASITVTPGDVAIGLGSSTMVVSKPVAAVEDKLTWRDGRLVFDRTSLAEVADDFNRYNRQQLLISDPSVATIRISGTFKASNVEAFVRLLKEAYGLKVELTTDGKLKIST
jgi:transmembrane sensor